MFPRRERLPKDVFGAPGRRFSTAHFSAFVPHSSARGCAVVISKKTLRLSVTRHRLKRRVLAALRALPLPAALVVYPRASALTLSPEEMRAELAVLLRGRA